MPLPKLLSSLGVRARAFLNARRQAAIRRRNAGILLRSRSTPTLEIRAEGMGMFAQLNWCLIIWRYYHAHGLPIQLCCTSQNYGGGKDWLGHFFETGMETQPASAPRVVLGDYCELPHEIAHHGLDFEVSRVLVPRYLRPRPFLTKLVDEFVLLHFQGRRVLGVHYRGTDKVSEAPRTAYPAFINAILAEIQSYKPERLFLATDETGFVNALREALPADLPLVMLTQERSDGSAPLHQGKAKVPPLDLGQTALLDVLLLSRCGRLIKTPSIFSGWAKVFNPDLPVVLFGNTHAHIDYFPDNRLAPRPD